VTAPAGRAGRVVLSAGLIASRVAELGSEIAREHPDGDLVLVAMLPKARRFAATLSRAIPVGHLLESIELSPYGDGDRASVRSGPRARLAGRPTLVVDVVVDTGLTLRVALARLAAAAPASLAACVLIDRPARRLVPELPLAHVGFTTAEDELAGYGLGVDEALATLPEVVSAPSR
jgi:hypoxanthine phosphoribosyltransferase